MDVPKPPEDLDLRNIIDKLAQFVARNGPEFENMTKNKQSENPKFQFLFGGEFNAYYRFRVASEEAILKNNEIIKGPQLTLQPPMVNSFYPSIQSFPQVSQAPSANNFVQNPHHHLLPNPFGEESFHHNNSQFLPQKPPMASAPQISTNFNNWQQHPNHPQQLNNLDDIDSQINQFHDHIKESEKNLTAQHEVIMGKEKEKKIEDLITKMLDDELKRMCEDYNINLNEFDKILQPIIESCRKESIANGKIWIFNNCHIPEHYDAVAKHLLKRVTRVDSKFEAKLHIMYLINDIFNHCMRKNDEKLKSSIEKIIVPAFSSVLLEANDERKQKMNKLLKLWEMNQYLDHSLLDQLRTPEQSLDAYKTSLCEKYAEQIQSINNEQSNKYNQIQKQHADFVAHCKMNIQQLQHQKQKNITPIRPPFSGTSNLYAPISGQVSGGLLPHPAPSLPYPSQPPNYVANPIALNPVNAAAAQQQQQPIHLPLQRPPFQASFSSPQGPPTNFFPNNAGPPIYPPNPPLPAQMMTIQPPTPAPNIHTPAPTIPPSQMLPIIPKQEEIQTPYFERPAGIMTQLIKLEDFDYNPIDPKEIKMPPLLPPSERLLKALEAFYAPPSHEHPRNQDGWEKLGLYEFFKAKSQARKEYEAKMGHEERIDSDALYDSDSSSLPTYSEKQQIQNDNNNNNKKTFLENRSSPSPSKRCYREFKEEKSPLRSRNGSLEKRRSKRSKSKSPICSYSKSPRSHRRESSPKFSKTRSNSPEPVKFNSIKRDSDNRLSDSKIGWSGNNKFMIKEQSNYQEMISTGSSRTSSEQYRGFGTSSTYSNPDPFESFRRNKGQAYIQRIREGRRD